jgi:hypothetical protein
MTFLITLQFFLSIFMAGPTGSLFILGSFDKQKKHT